jgi:predicted anti-sigma-YlaC factor YlaD
MPLNCSEMKHLIHLDVGDDLRAEEEHQLAAHMEQCSDCRSYHAGMSQAMNALLSLRDDPAIAVGNRSTKSVWPAVSRQIRRHSTSPRVARKFNLQVVALSVCSLSLAVVTMVQSLSAMRDYRNPTNFVPAQSVSTQSLRHINGNPVTGQTQFLPQGAPTSMPQSF